MTATKRSGESGFEFEGKCEICGATHIRTAMTRHLSACIRKETLDLPRPNQRSTGVVDACHVVAEGAGLAAYWLHVAIPKDATLADLDGYLRETWLECCGHMSAFRTRDGHQFNTMKRGDLGWMRGDSSMDVLVGKALQKGTTLEYDYDFGSTTTLRLRVVGEPVVLRPRGTGIRLLARNFSPRVTCATCGKRNAALICPGCWGSFEALLCSHCGQDHGCGQEMLLPLVNSPRTGVCCYTGGD